MGQEGAAAAEHCILRQAHAHTCSRFGAALFVWRSAASAGLSSPPYAVHAGLQVCALCAQMRQALSWGVLGKDVPSVRVAAAREGKAVLDSHHGMYAACRAC